MILAVTMLWTVFAGLQETGFQYPTEQECKAAIAKGLSDLPNKEPLHCQPAIDHATKYRSTPQ
jgi:hypothetical protein